MSEERRQRFEKYFNQIDKNNSGHLSYEEFKTFLTQYNEGEMPEKLNELYFRGADCDNGGYIDKEELWGLVEALQNKDQLALNKLFFRAVDKDRSRQIDAKEFLIIADINNKKMSEKDAEDQIKRITGGSSVMNFAQMHKALTGEDIPESTDPFEGKLQNARKRNVNSNNESCLTEADRNSIKELFAKYDTSGNGKLEFNEFLGFMREALNIGDSPSPSFVKQMRFIYDGMDLDGSHNLDQSEIIECFEKIKAKDFKYQTRMIFRGADKNHNRKVTIDELKLAVENLGDKSFNQESFDAQCKQEFGSKKKELEYWEFYKIISGETLDKNSPDYDPYEGKLQEKKSKCCLLL